ncbi:MAG TPA: hypothetical protein PLC03_10945 [Microthrixaceae bacterium]|nr:hypothetical protein [Microthrixaceae bacterium]HNG24469.1 hypothetical protein [Microthrixaceae bacterium]
MADGHRCVVHDATVAVGHEAADEVRSHPSESDHAELHRGVGRHVGPPSWSGTGSGTRSSLGQRPRRAR